MQVRNYFREAAIIPSVRSDPEPRTRRGSPGVIALGGERTSSLQRLVERGRHHVRLDELDRLGRRRDGRDVGDRRRHDELGHE